MSLDMADHEDVMRLAEQLNETANKLIPSNNNRSDININAGGVGVWISVTACVLMFFMGVVIIIAGSYALQEQNGRIQDQKDEIRDMKGKVDKMQDYLNAIYAVAPQLKPKEETK